MDGIIQAKTLPPLFIGDFLLVGGERKNGYVDIVVFDFINNKRTEFAKMKIIYEYPDGISASEVQPLLEVRTIRQARKYFPKQFIIEKTNEKTSILNSLP